jgi:hypothetical protein
MAIEVAGCSISKVINPLNIKPIDIPQLIQSLSELTVKNRGKDDK